MGGLSSSCWSLSIADIWLWPSYRPGSVAEARGLLCTLPTFDAGAVTGSPIFWVRREKST